MIKDGIGGGNTTTGLVFETKADLKTLLNGLKNYNVDKENNVFYKDKLVGMIFVKNGLYKFLEKNMVNWQDYLSKKLLPDDSIYVILNNTFYVIECKYQQVAGSVDEKLQYINNKEFSGDISGSFAVKARRAIRQFKPDAEKRVSNAQSMADVLQRVYDLNSGAADSTEYLNGIRSIRESVVDLHSSGEITTKDAMSLNNQISTATRARVAEATFDVSYKFNDARDYFKTTLPPEYQNEAIRDLFYSTQDLNLDGKSEKEIDRIYQKKAVEISNNILKNGRLNAEKAYQNITAASDDQFISSLASQRGVDTETINKDIDETAQKYGISREEVINRLKGNM